MSSVGSRHGWPLVQWPRPSQLVTQQERSCLSPQGDCHLAHCQLAGSGARPHKQPPAPTGSGRIPRRRLRAGATPRTQRVGMAGPRRPVGITTLPAKRRDGTVLFCLPDLKSASQTEATRCAMRRSGSADKHTLLCGRAYRSVLSGQAPVTVEVSPRSSACCGLAAQAAG